MSSLIPKIRLGRDTKRNQFDLSCMTHTTSEIGYVQPTFGRTIVPKTKVRVGTRTSSRLSPLFVPTMGKIDIRHYHCFVPYTTLWSPFDAFITRQNYTLNNGTTYVPKKCPYFSVKKSLGGLLGTTFQFTSGYDPHTDLVGCIVKSAGRMLSSSEIDTANGNGKIDYFVRNVNLGIVPYLIVSSDGNIHKLVLDNDVYKYDYYLDNFLNGDQNWIDRAQADLKQKYSFPSQYQFDFNVVGTTALGSAEKWRFNCNFNGGLKRLRTIFMGLGYSFNPYDKVDCTPFKLLAYYKAYFALFGVNREKNFYNTYCYKIIKLLSESTTLDLHTIGTPLTLWLNFLREDLCNCTYTCPVDYFSVADTTTMRGAYGDTDAIISPLSTVGGSISSVSGSTSQNSSGVASTPAGNALGMQIATRLMRFINKNSVVGRKISDILRSRYGVTDIHNMAHESVIRVGASSTNIDIAAIYCNSDTQDVPLGGYAGAGMSSQRDANSKIFTFETNEFGVLITLTAVVPKMGYYQGMLKENVDGVNDYTEFYQPEFDGLGYQAVQYYELVADKMVDYGSSPDASLGTKDLGVWGYVPRMTHLKCSFNRCLGDISIPHMQDSMLPYTLDRYFPNKDFDGYGNATPSVKPVNEAQSFRSGTQGHTNRIFVDMNPTEDHVIMQIFFDVKMSAPMKSISTSFDTWDEESENAIEVAHE